MRVLPGLMRLDHLYDSCTRHGSALQYKVVQVSPAVGGCQHTKIDLECGFGGLRMSQQQHYEEG